MFLCDTPTTCLRCAHTDRWVGIAQVTTFRQTTVFHRRALTHQLKFLHSPPDKSEHTQTRHYACAHSMLVCLHRWCRLFHAFCLFQMKHIFMHGDVLLLLLEAFDWGSLSCTVPNTLVWPALILSSFFI